MELDVDGPSAEANGLRTPNEPNMNDEMETELTELVNEQQFEPPDVSQTQQYLQAETISAQDVNDWANLPELPRRQLGLAQTITNIYRSSFTILLQAWNCPPAECIPAELRTRTPYSLGLVVRLAELALLTRGCRDHAHTMLRTLVQDRSARLATPPNFIVVTGMARGMPHKRFVEHRVQEYVGGLMIDDVEIAKVQCMTTPGYQPAKIPAESRADRAARRKNRSHSLPPGQDAISQNQRPHYEAHVGDGARGLEWFKEQHKQQRSIRPAIRGRGKRDRKRREEILGSRPRRSVEERASNGSPTGDDQQMQDAAASEQMGDSTRVSFTSSHQEPPKDQTRRRQRKPRSAKQRAKTVDGFMARIFDGISMENGGEPNDGGRQAIQTPAFLIAEQQTSDKALPSERSGLPSSPNGTA
ncbi:uncharacterized protein RCC_08269 [Ramularia collo-cygni]|uniref:Uncharacterized protein n=1 Tax=Ramularia collo-cygni TaxID=112498 RepID=A0A2D3VJW0_9PEZI|nr:uncharacterized protein RCC_08269 [Ramularia collo-cygni]CZT22399.1 uncharacterized protein RCC_08269 [Ramularia collo-cygni]